jgi:hypothetical protein
LRCKLSGAFLLESEFFIRLLTNTDHILTKAMHAVILSRHEPAGNKMPHLGQLSTLIQHPAFHLALPCNQQGVRFGGKGIPFDPKSKEVT